jgi:hypothetical protein
VVKIRRTDGHQIPVGGVKSVGLKSEPLKSVGLWTFG